MRVYTLQEIKYPSKKYVSGAGKQCQAPSINGSAVADVRVKMWLSIGAWRTSAVLGLRNKLDAPEDGGLAL